MNEDIKRLLGDNAIEFKAIPFRSGFITGLNYAYMTMENRFFFYRALTGSRSEISADRYRLINQPVEAF